MSLRTHAAPPSSRTFSRCSTVSLTTNGTVSDVSDKGLRPWPRSPGGLFGCSMAR